MRPILAVTPPISQWFTTSLVRARALPIYPGLCMATLAAGLNVLLFTRFQMTLQREWEAESWKIDGGLISCLLCNLSLLGLFLLVRTRILQPWRRLSHIIHHASHVVVEERGVLSPRRMAGELACFASKHRELQRELEQSRRLLAQLSEQQQTIVASTNREIHMQYRNVLSYANYLDEHIQREQRNHELRYDFDDVCESSFNLKLMAQSLELLRRNSTKMETVPLARLMQQTMIALAPTLERRSMKLSTVGVNETLEVNTDITLLAHALWVMLLGTIRYAAPESTLKLFCLPSDDASHATLRIVISELSPGQLTPMERQAHLARQLQHVTPHMFAETIRLHGNVQLAQLLLARISGEVQILPISSYACEISMVLPFSKK